MANFVEGVCWQLDNPTVSLPIVGNWDLLGAGTLWTQWSIVRQGGARYDYSPWLAQPPAFWASVLGPVPRRPAWAKDMIVGLVGDIADPASPSDLAYLAEASRTFAREFAVQCKDYAPKGYYFPVEINPSWMACDLKKMNAALIELRTVAAPLWVSAFSGDPGLPPDEFADWLDLWLPPNVGLIFHDGVWAHRRSVDGARLYADSLKAKLGPTNDRLIIDVECNRWPPDVATPQALAEQIRIYEGQFRLYLFDGPHYLPPDKVVELVNELQK